MFQHAQNEAENLSGVKKSGKFTGLACYVYCTFFETLVCLGSG